MPDWLLPGPFPPAFATDERCTITELLNDPACPEASLALARVEPGVTTRLHAVAGTIERYVILSGKGIVEVGGESARVRPGDRVLIPAGVPSASSPSAPRRSRSTACARRASARRTTSTSATRVRSGEGHPQRHRHHHQVLGQRHEAEGTFEPPPTQAWSPRRGRT
jgi:hypothetical protein